jgi:hypothetical protein
LEGESHGLTYPGELRKTTKTPVRMAGVLAEIKWFNIIIFVN